MVTLGLSLFLMTGAVPHMSGTLASQIAFSAIPMGGGALPLAPLAALAF